MSALPQADLERSFPRQFVPQDADMSDWSQIKPLITKLLGHAPSSSEELEQWISDYSELIGAVEEEGTKRLISMTLQTDDLAREEALRHFVENIEPKMKLVAQACEKAYLQSPARKLLPRERYAMLDRIIENNVSIFREENVPLETEENLLKKDYQKLVGAMTVTVNGSEQTYQQALKNLEKPDRDVRQQVWEKISARYLQDKGKVEELYDRLIALRTRIATNAGFANYRDYIFPFRRRFDYTPEDCFRFHESVERAVLPIVSRILNRRRQRLGLNTLRPWDLDVDPDLRPPLTPFSTVTELVDGTQTVFSRVHPAFGEYFKFMREHDLLDVESRKGKVPGGYQTVLSEQRVPFIFANAVGRDADVLTMAHEGGHAMHTFAARNDPILYYRYTTPEFCEVASMAMVLLARPHLGVFYSDQQDVQRARRCWLEDAVLRLPEIAVGDAFQQWVYTNPTHTRSERAQAWRRLHARFMPVTDWTGYEEARDYRWQQILIFFELPFYFVEYGFAQIGAFQVWMRSRSDYENAVERYWSALALGGTRPLPELFAVAGGRFAFDYETLKPLMNAVAEELEGD